MQRFEMINSYNIECLVKEDDNYSENFETHWIANIVVDKNNLFYGIATDQIGKEYLISGVYVENKGINVRLFSLENNYVKEYVNIENDKNINGVVNGIFQNSVQGIGECSLKINQNSNINIEVLSQKINNIITTLKNNRFQAALFLDCVNNSNQMVEEINDAYKSGNPFLH